MSADIIGTAAALSNDFPLAEQLLLDAETRLQQFVGRAEGAPVSVLLDRVKRRLVELYREWLQRATRQFTKTRNPDEIRNESLITKLRQRGQDDYGVRVAAGFVAFMLHRDLVTARREIQACNGSNDATWRYSEAFLHAYEGDLQSAYRSYRRAFESPLDDLSVPTQCEEFILTVIEQEPQRRWLYYCLGLINYRAKGDLEAARRDLQIFRDGVDTQRFQREIAYARQWIAEIDSLLTPAPAGV